MWKRNKRGMREEEERREAEGKFNLHRIYCEDETDYFYFVEQEQITTPMELLRYRTPIENKKGV
jgi:hypothetical protein